MFLYVRVRFNYLETLTWKTMSGETRCFSKLERNGYVGWRTQIIKSRRPFCPARGTDYGGLEKREYYNKFVGSMLWSVPNSLLPGLGNRDYRFMYDFQKIFFFLINEHLLSLKTGRCVLYSSKILSAKSHHPTHTPPTHPQFNFSII